jgi:hypothetical protein
VNTSADIRIRLDTLVWTGGMFVAVFGLSIMLARNWFVAAVFTAAIVWLVTLPHHAPMALAISTATFNSAFIVPFTPGPLTVADAGLLLAFSGIPLVIMLRRYPDDTSSVLHRNWAIFAGIFLYLCILVVLIYARGVGFGFMGATAGGGRVYFKQFASAALPLLFVVCPVGERNFVRLVTLHFLLSASFLVSDLMLAIWPGVAGIILNFLQLPTDAAFFEFSTRQFGFRRLQSLYYVCPKLVFALLMYYSLKDVLGRRSWWLIPAIVGLLVAGLGSGHRANLIHTGMVLLVLLWVQRAFTTRNVLAMGLGTVLGLVALYVTVEHLPAAVQRAVSFLPGIDVDSAVAADAAATYHSRVQTAWRGIEMMPDYLLLGRGFTRYADIIPNSREAFDSVAYAVLQGHFLNGFVGLMVNTGIFGTLGMCLFLMGGVYLVRRVIKQVRIAGFDSSLARTGSILASLFLVDLVFFFLIEGNVDWALSRFGIYAGMLMACERLLRERFQQEEMQREIEEAEQAGESAA